ncbi:DUF3515 domain-containing protein [Nocardiopsis sp. NPDC050513]|uniref:DUF3515 domain-containing protein n=1 Tax=Nocardiopsis sp. NPDC050513 TaxID=3364338 RepID=UPI0037A9EF0A
MGAAVAAVLSATGCGAGTVRMEPPEADETTTQACTAFVAALPDTLLDAERADVRPESDVMAAWGDPPIGVRCGIPRPAALTIDAPLQEVDGVPWLPVPADDPTMFVAVGHTAYVELTAPPSYGPPAAALTTLSTLVEEHIPPLPGDRL